MGQTITDARGRAISVRKVGVLEQMRLFKVLGPELSRNDVYVSLAVIAASAEMIDGLPILFPTSEVAVEAIVERLGEEGVRAIDSLSEPTDITLLAANAGNF